MNRRRDSGFPTARNTGQAVPLLLYVGKDVVTGGSVAQFLLSVLEYVERRDRLAKLQLPFLTSGTSYLVSIEPKNAEGIEFRAHVSYVTAENIALFINTNHPRFFALRQGARLLEAVGLTPTLVLNDSITRLPDWTSVDAAGDVVAEIKL